MFFLPSRLKYNRKENLRVFYSTVNKMPHELDHEHEYTKPKKISIWAQGRSKEFEKDYAYLAFLCRNQISVDVLVKFNTMEKALGKKKEEIPEDQNLAQELQSEVRDDGLELDDSPAKSEKSEINDDIIKKNKRIAVKWKEINQQKLESKKNELPRKIEIAKANQRKLFLQNMKQVSVNNKNFRRNSFLKDGMSSGNSERKLGFRMNFMRSVKFLTDFGKGCLINDRLLRAFMKNSRQERKKSSSLSGCFTAQTGSREILKSR